MRKFILAIFFSLAAFSAAAQDSKYVETMVGNDDRVIRVPNFEFFKRLKEECRNQTNITKYLQCHLMVDQVIAAELLMINSEPSARRYQEFMDATRRLLEHFPALRIAVLPAS
jgi:hypothetical protein